MGRWWGSGFLMFTNRLKAYWPALPEHFNMEIVHSPSCTIPTRTSPLHSREWSIHSEPGKALNCRIMRATLPSNRSLLKDLKSTHCNYRASIEFGIVICHHYLPMSGVGRMQASAFFGCGSHFAYSITESNHNFPSPVTNMIGMSHHQNLIGQAFERCVAVTYRTRSAQSYPVNSGYYMCVNKSQKMAEFI